MKVIFFETEISKYDEIYSYKITALNEGGESFPSETLAVGLTEGGKKPILIVNCFDRISGPAFIDAGDFAGVAHWQDEGVPDKYNIGYTGEQYDFDRNSPWLDDDSPGWGASYANMEGKPVPGNSFDNPYIHGQAILKAGYSFVSVSDETFSNPKFDINPYKTLDLIYGEEKTKDRFGGKTYAIFDPDIRQKITDFTKNKGNVFASGANIASDFIINKDTVAMKFAQDILHYKWRTNYAVKTGKVYATDYAGIAFSGSWYFNTNFHPTVYKVEAPDAVEPVGPGATSAFRYSETNASAGTVFHGDYKTVILGFPFETILDETERDTMMKQVLDFFEIESVEK